MNKRQCQTNGDRREARRGVFVGRAVDHQQEAGGQYNFNHNGREHRVAAGRVLTEAVGSKTAGCGVKAALPLAIT